MFTIRDTKQVAVEKNKVVIKQLYKDTASVYILGRNEYCLHTIRGFECLGIKISGVIDDFTNDTDFHGLMVIKMEEIPVQSIVISCVIEGKLVTAIDTLKKHGVTSILTYFDLYLYKPNIFPAVPFTENNLIDIKDNLPAYDWLYSILADIKSKESLKNIIDFRYNFNPEVMRFFKYRLKDQYFEKIIKFTDNEIFVDCGSYDGSTTKEFIKRNPKYQEIYVFEASPDNYKLTLENLSPYKRIHCLQKATFSNETKLKFRSDKGSASSLSDDGEIVVGTIQLDDVVPAATYIKIDVEGAELDTLLGARKLITDFKPKLAVCVYHNQKHFWEIPKLILSINPEYSVFLRHYTEGLFETVMYFV